MRAVLVLIGLSSAPAWAQIVNEPHPTGPPPFGPCVAGPGTKLSTEEVVEQAWKTLKEDPNFKGIAVGVVRNGKRQKNGFFAGVGAHTMMTARPPDEHTLYEIGSITKSFTGLLLAVLKEKGKVDPGEPVAKLLPNTYKSNGKDVPLALLNDRKDITLFNLVTHTAGLMKTACVLDCPAKRKDVDECGFTLDVLWATLAYCPLNAAGHRENRQLMPTAVYVPRQVWTYTNHDDLADVSPFGSRNTEVIPGTESQYSNIGFAALGRLLQLKFHKPWEDLLQEHVTGPLKMTATRTVTDPTTFIAPANVAMPNGNPADNRFFGSQPVDDPAGGLFSNIEDMTTYLLAMMGHGAANQSTDMTNAIKNATKVSFNKYGKRIGYSWNHDPLLQESCADMVWKGGDMPGFNAWIGWVPSEDNGVVVLSNWYPKSGAAAPTIIGERILRALHGATWTN